MSMSEFFGSVVASIFCIYAVLCMIVVPVNSWKEQAEERACAEQYQVYECIKVEGWKPKEASHD